MDRRGGGRWIAFRAGTAYSRHCLTSGWAVMLVMFSVGVGELVWMAALAQAMLTEKTLPSGQHVGAGVAGGLALVAAGTLIGAHI